MAKKPTKRPMPIRLSAETYQSAHDVLALVSRYGWASLGVDRSDPPTLMAVVEEAMRLLVAHARKRGSDAGK